MDRMGKVEDAGARALLRIPGRLLLLGQLLYIVVTQFHVGGDGNDHRAIFAEYAANGTWAAVHLGQFACMAVLLAGLLALFVVLDLQAGAVTWVGRFGVATTVAALALYGVLQAVDGVALKQAVNAWASAPEAEKGARFMSAEAIRWLEWGLRSYHDLALGLALLLCAASTLRVVRIPRPIAYLMGLSGLIYLVQGWVAGSEGFSPAQSVAIVLAWVLSLIWMIWLVVLAGR
jgi:hypothetical protein